MKPPKPDPYSTLGVKPGASEAEIKAAFRKLSKIHHPDKNGGSSEEFRKILDAYEELTKPNKGGWEMGGFESGGDAFSQFFSFLAHAPHGWGGNQARHALHLDIRISISINPRIAFDGGQITIEYIRNLFSSDPPGRIASEKKRSQIEIPRRMANGHRIMVKGDGHRYGEKNGNLIVTIEYPFSGEDYAIDRFGNLAVRVQVP